MTGSAYGHDARALSKLAELVVQCLERRGIAE